MPNCVAALCGSETPTWAYTYMMKPEQSNPDGTAPPHTYGTPRYCIAMPDDCRRSGRARRRAGVLGGAGVGDVETIERVPLPRRCRALRLALELGLAARLGRLDLLDLARIDDELLALGELRLDRGLLVGAFLRRHDPPPPRAFFSSILALLDAARKMRPDLSTLTQSWLETRSTVSIRSSRSSRLVAPSSISERRRAWSPEV